jgi:hypothetical protein
MQTPTRLFQILGLASLLFLLYCGISFYRWLKPSVTYESLESLLQSGDLAKADAETSKILLRLSRSDYMGFYPINPRLYSFYNIPCNDLLTVDRLWSSYSKNKFGLFIQSDRWQELTDGTGIEAHFIDYRSPEGKKIRHAVEEIGKWARFPATDNFANIAPGSLPSTGWLFEGTPNMHDPARTIDEFYSRIEECSTG